MRMSLLLHREPFGQILETTLAKFWSEKYQKEYKVRWHTKIGKLHHAFNTSCQNWLVNLHLNAIFTPGATADVFDPIRREFTHSPIWWRRPFQSTYVALALAPSTSAWFAKNMLTVNAPVPNARDIIIVGGNHKIRILNHQQNTAYGIRKSGFSKEFIQSEIESRQLAQAYNIPVPAIYEFAPDYGWFAEEYISGTPLNRLTDNSFRNSITNDAVISLSKLHKGTLVEESLDVYLLGLTKNILTKVERNLLFDPELKVLLNDIVNRLMAFLAKDSNTKIRLATAHGDFQPGNVLINDYGYWLIDWEYSCRRQVAYDLFVFFFESRFATGLAMQLSQFVEHGWTETYNSYFNMIADDLSTSRARQSKAVLFLLEELHLHLNENNSGMLTSVSQGLLNMISETQQYIACLESK